jgi:hypothetical protein
MMVRRLVYLMFSKVLGWMTLRARSDTTTEIEILVVRHQLAVLRRGSPRPRMNWTDRALIATLTRLLPPPRRLGLIVTPATILRWHLQLIARRWTTQPARPGRPATPAGLRVLVLRLATETPPGGTAAPTASWPACWPPSKMPMTAPFRMTTGTGLSGRCSSSRWRRGRHGGVALASAPRVSSSA